MDRHIVMPYKAFTFYGYITVTEEIELTCHNV